jgi:hypothetical protein
VRLLLNGGVNGALEREVVRKGGIHPEGFRTNRKQKRREGKERNERRRSRSGG